MKKIRYFLGWIFVSPRRWLFSNMICNSFGIRWLPEKEPISNTWLYPNIHWWLLYKTVFNFCYWLCWEGWRPFCTWKNGCLENIPLIALFIRRIGKTTAGYATSGGECFHCGSEEGCQVELSQDETGEFFKLEKTWIVGTQNGTDYCFCGTTICPKCGYEDYYEDGSL